MTKLSLNLLGFENYPKSNPILTCSPLPVKDY